MDWKKCVKISKPNPLIRQCANNGGYWAGEICKCLDSEQEWTGKKCVKISKPNPLIRQCANNGGYWAGEICKCLDSEQEWTGKKCVKSQSLIL